MIRETTVSRTYAEALLEFAQRDDAIELYGERLQQVADMIETQDEFRRFLEAPGIQPAQKIALLRDVLGDLLPAHLLSFLFIVIEKRRQRLLPSIAHEFANLVDEHYGRLRVLVTVSGEPDQASKKDIKRRLDEILGRDSIPHFRADPRILGGVVFRVGDRVADGSVRRRLQLMRRRLLSVDGAR